MASCDTASSTDLVLVRGAHSPTSPASVARNGSCTELDRGLHSLSMASFTVSRVGSVDSLGGFITDNLHKYAEAEEGAGVSSPEAESSPHDSARKGAAARAAAEGARPAAVGMGAGGGLAAGAGTGIGRAGSGGLMPLPSPTLKPRRKPSDSMVSAEAGGDAAGEVGGSDRERERGCWESNVGGGGTCTDRDTDGGDRSSDNRGGSGDVGVCEGSGAGGNGGGGVSLKVGPGLCSNRLIKRNLNPRFLS
jgi:hypothetical protein